jgi:hypothetical protein
MTDYEVIRSMVLNFRLTELQHLLTYAGQSRAGRKTELQVRLKHTFQIITELNVQPNYHMFDCFFQSLLSFVNDLYRSQIFIIGSFSKLKFELFNGYPF